MLKSFVLTGVATLALGAALALPQSASANWAGAAAANQAAAAGLSDVIEVQRRRVRVRVGPSWRGAHWRGGGVWWGAPFVAAPFVWGAWGAPYAFAGPRCGWVWSPRLFRNVWRCW